MKLLTGTLKGKDWEEVLPEQDQAQWREILKGYVELPNITIPRFCLPGSGKSSSKIRLICLAQGSVQKDEGSKRLKETGQEDYTRLHEMSSSREKNLGIKASKSS